MSMYIHTYIHTDRRVIYNTADIDYLHSTVSVVPWALSGNWTPFCQTLQLCSQVCSRSLAEHYSTFRVCVVMFWTGTVGMNRTEESERLWAVCVCVVVDVLVCPFVCIYWSRDFVDTHTHTPLSSLPQDQARRSRHPSASQRRRFSTSTSSVSVEDEGSMSESS